MEKDMMKIGKGEKTWESVVKESIKDMKEIYGKLVENQSKMEDYLKRLVSTVSKHKTP